MTGPEIRKAADAAYDAHKAAGRAADDMRADAAGNSPASAVAQDAFCDLKAAESALARAATALYVAASHAQ